MSSSRAGRVEITREQAEAIAKVVLLDYPANPRPNPKWGRPATLPSSRQRAGSRYRIACRLLIVDVGRDVDYVFARIEQMMPLLPVLHARDFAEALDWGHAPWERDRKHTASLHSRDIDHMDAMAKRREHEPFRQERALHRGARRRRRGLDPP